MGKDQTLKKDDNAKEIQNTQNGPTRDRKCTDCIFFFIFAFFWAFSVYIMIHGFKNGDPTKLTQMYDKDGNPCGKLDTPTQDYPFAFFYHPLKSFGSAVCVKQCPTWFEGQQRPLKLDCYSNTNNPIDCVHTGDFGFEKLPDKFVNYYVEEFLIYNTTALFGRTCMIDVTDPSQINQMWFQNMTMVSQGIDKVGDYLADIKASYQHMIIIAVIALVISILSMLIVRYLAGLFVWITILLFLASLFFVGFYANKEYTRLLSISQEANFESEQNNNYYNAQNLLWASRIAYTLGVISIFIVLFNMSAISLAIAVIKSAALYVASNFQIILVPILFGGIAILYIIAWAVGLAYLWSIGEEKKRSLSPFNEIIWDNKTLYYILFHCFACLWNMAFLLYLMIFVVACSCAIWYFNNKNSPNHFRMPIAIGFWWAFRYHLGSLALGSFILAIIWTIQIILAYVAKRVQKLKENGVSSKMVDYVIKCLMIFVSCFERIVKFLSKLGFIQVAVTSENFCTSCVKAFLLLIQNPMKFGFLHAIGQVFTFIGRLFITGISGAIGFALLNYYKTEVKEELSSELFPVIVFMIIGFLISSLFFSIYGIAADTIILCFFRDKQLSEKGGRPVNAPAPMKSFYEKFKKQQLIFQSIIMEGKKSILKDSEHPLLKEEAIQNVVLLEEELMRKNCSIQQIADLTKVYSDLIEYYDFRQDPIKNYFMEKIQILLSNKETLIILDKGQTDKDIENYQRKSKISINKKKELRSQMAEFHSKVNKLDQKEKTQSIQSMLDSHKEKFKNIDNHVQKEIKNQEDVFNRKMKQRRERSINRSLSRSVEKKRKKKGDDDKNINTNNVLKALSKKNKGDNPFEK